MRPNFIVGIGGSAGGLVAYTALLDELHPKTGMAFVIVCHMNPTANSQLAEILAKRTKMPVLVASAAMPIKANHVYVIPPDADLLIDGYAFKLISPRAKRNTQVDIFLTSLAGSMGERAVAVILSGYDGDGAAGCKAIKIKGGTTFAQDDSAEVPGMPQSAQESGYVDLVSSPAGIARDLQRIAKAKRR